MNILKYVFLSSLLVFFPATVLAFSCDEVTEIPKVECEALVALYTSTNGASWSDSPSNNWNMTNTPCSWAGVICSGSKVTRLYLSSNQLTGTIPTELGNLVNLTDLWLSSNQLTGMIPTELGNLVNLEGLYLDDNQLTGTIPTELGNLVNLTGLSLDSNQLTGTIPTELGNLVNLIRLYLFSNQLTGTIPTELGNLVNLKGLDLSHNELTGMIPTELGNLVNLTDLWLRQNQLTGTIPTELGNLVNLKYLGLSSNQLTGTIPLELGQLSSLQYFHLGYNHLCTTDQKLIAFLDGIQYTNWREEQTNTVCGGLPIVNQCATYNLNKLTIPCVKVRETVYKTELNQISAPNNIMRFEVDMNTLTELTTTASTDCAVYPYGEFNHLRLNCVTLGNDKYWAEFDLVNNPNATQFEVIDYGLKEQA